MIRTYQGIQTNKISWNNAMRAMQQQQRQFYVQSPHCLSVVTPPLISRLMI